jgi:hypothetical protein
MAALRRIWRLPSAWPPSSRPPASTSPPWSTCSTPYTRTPRRTASTTVCTRSTAPSLLIVDEMGYFPLDRMAAQFLFQLVSRRYQRGSIILTSNKSYGDWGDIFADQVLATAILDRLLHFSTTINIRGQSYRLRKKCKAGVFTELTEPQKEA